MKIKLLSCLLLCLLMLALPLSAAPPKGGQGAHQALRVDNTQIIDANRIMMFVTNHGNFGRDLSGYFGYDYGTWYPFSDTTSIRNNSNNAGDHSPLYAAGLWIGAVDSATSTTRIAISEYSDEYVPGTMTDSGTFTPDNPSFHVYKLYSDSMQGNPNSDYLNWPVDQGAPVEKDSVGNTIYDDNGYPIPEMYGDQMCWSVYNDADPAQHTNDAGKTAPLGIEVRQATFAFSQEGSLGNLIFLRWRLYNRGSNVLTNAYISIWADPDLGGAGDDLVGCDTSLGVGYIYNANNNDAQYGATPPCLAFDFFQGPLVPTGVVTDTGRMWGQRYASHRNMNMTAFDKYINGTDPRDYHETYNYMRGLNRDGTPYVYNGDTLSFQMSGDPVAGTGDLDIAPNDRRFMMSTGPITFRPGDSLEILAALIVGQGSDRLGSITAMKGLDAFAQRLYDNDFKATKAPAPPDVKVTRLEKEIVLTWGDTSEVNHGDYDFQGYTVWQGPTAAGPWTVLNTYDVVDNFTDALIDSLPLPGTTILMPVIERLISNTGLRHSYSITKDALTGDDLYPIQTYYFRVSAFSFDYIAPDNTVVPNGERFHESQTTVSATPQAPPAGIHPQAANGDTVAVAHVGPSDGAVHVSIVDPVALTGDTYRVIFNQVPGGIVWQLLDATTGDTLLLNQTNQSGDNAYFVKDGIMVKVVGPPLAGKDYTYTVPDPLNISPVAQAADPTYEGNTRWFTGDPANGGELLFGAVFMEPNFWGETSLLPGQNPPVEIRWRPMQSYTDLNGNGQYDIGEPYVVDDPTKTQGAFMYQTFDSTAYEGFYSVPFTAWDVSDPNNPRQVNVVVRDRDANHQWDLQNAADPPDSLLPNDGDQQYNYTWITTTDYDPTGTHYGDGVGGSSVNFWSYDNYNGVWDAAWCMWLYPRGTYPPLAEQCTLTLIPPNLNLPADTFSFSVPKPTVTHAQGDLDAIKAVPNPFYLTGPYDPAQGSYLLKFYHLPPTCTIKIYNLAGELVRTIQKSDASTSIASWDLLTERGLPVASGIYIYVVDAPGYGQKIGKMAILVQSEVLKIY